MSFTCDVCGETHAGETRDIRMGLPQPIFLLDEDEREAGVPPGRATTWPCSGATPVSASRCGRCSSCRSRGEDGYFGYGAWVEVSEPDFAALGELWDDEDGWRGRSGCGPRWRTS